jgi:outer membrane protein
MNKINLSVAMVALATAIFSLFKSQQNAALVYVDVNKLLEGYKKTAVVRAEFQEKTAVLRANVDSLLVDWQKELKAYEKERSKMSKKELALQQELLGNKQQQVNNYQQAIQKQLHSEDQKTTQTVVNDINAYVKEYGKKHRYKIIFGASGGGNIMYAGEGTNLTAEVLEGLNATYGD